MLTIRYVLAELDTNGKNLQKNTAVLPHPEIRDRYFSLTSRFAFSDSFFICGHEKAPPNYHISTGPGGLKFHYVVRGKGTFNGIPFGEKSIFITRENFGKVLVSDSEEPWEVFWCVWHGALAKSILGKMNRYEDNRIYPADPDIKLEDLFRYMIYNRHHERKLEKAVFAFSDMLLFESHTVNSSQRGNRDSRHANIIHEIQSFINQSFRTTTVEEIAQKFHYNRRYLSSIFQAEAGITIQDAIRNAKLRCAEAYLMEKQVSMEEIAICAGYSNYSAFIKAFKKKYNMTPSEFIQFNSEF